MKLKVMYVSGRDEIFNDVLNWRVGNNFLIIDFENCVHAIKVDKIDEIIGDK